MTSYVWSKSQERAFIIIPVLAIIIIGIIMILLILLLPRVSAFYTGYNSYGMDRTKANNILSEIPTNLTLGLGSIIFSNSKCVGAWGNGCDLASFEYKGSWNRIIIGNYATIKPECLKLYLYHELKHLEQRRTGRIIDGQNGFSEALELEAENYASEQVKNYECG
jgi:hypothetical protein